MRWDCFGDMVVTRKNIDYYSVDVPQSMIPSESELPCWITDRVGISLVVWKLPPALVWRDRKQCAAGENMANTFIRLMNPFVADPFGQHNVWNQEPGSLILTRKDGKPLHPAHLIALILYMEEKNDEAVELQWDKLEAYRASYSRDDLKKFWQEWTEEFADDDEFPGKGVPSPYEV